MEDNLSAVLVGKQDLQLLQKPKPKAGKNQVLIAMKMVGICGTDVHYLQNGGISDLVVKEPIILGHEPAGMVVEIGEGVETLKPGDRVALEPGIPCRKCELCKRGKYNLCKDIVFTATPPYDGTLTRYFAHEADFCVKLPDHVSYEEGALLEPLAVAVHACKRVGVTVGDKVLICGAGPVGVLCLLVAKAFGAEKVCLTDIAPDRLEFAKSLGADFGVNVRGLTPEQAAKKVEEEIGKKPTISIECSGAEPSLQTSVYATQSGGKVLLVGIGAPLSRVPVFDALHREIDIIGVFRFANDYEDALGLIATGKVNVMPLVTHRFPLEQSLEAFETARTGAGGAVKVMIDCSLKE